MTVYYVPCNKQRKRTKISFEEKGDFNNRFPVENVEGKNQYFRTARGNWGHMELFRRKPIFDRFRNPSKRSANRETEADGPAQLHYAAKKKKGQKINEFFIQLFVRAK